MSVLIEKLGQELSREIIQTSHAPAAVGPYSQAIKAAPFVFVSGQLGLDQNSGSLVDGLEAQTRQVLENLKSILRESGSDLTNVVKTTIFLTNMADFSAVNAIYAEAFSDAPPARSTVEVASLPLGGLIEIEAIALIG